MYNICKINWVNILNMAAMLTYSCSEQMTSCNSLQANTTSTLKCSEISFFCFGKYYIKCRKVRKLREPSQQTELVLAKMPPTPLRPHFLGKPDIYQWSPGISQLKPWGKWSIFKAKTSILKFKSRRGKWKFPYVKTFKSQHSNPTYSSTITPGINVRMKNRENRRWVVI